VRSRPFSEDDPHNDYRLLEGCHHPSTAVPGVTPDRLKLDREDAGKARPVYNISTTVYFTRWILFVKFGLSGALREGLQSTIEEPDEGDSSPARKGARQAEIVSCEPVNVSDVSERSPRDYMRCTYSSLVPTTLLPPLHTQVGTGPATGGAGHGVLCLTSGLP